MSNTPVDGERADAADVRQWGLSASKAASPVAGQLYFATDESKMYFCFSAGSWSEVSGVPQNGIMWTTATSAPTGYTEFTAGRGRVIVGTPSGGTHAGTVGTALTNQQDKTHTHTTPYTGFSRQAGYSADRIVLFDGVGAIGNAGYANANPATGTAATSDVIAYIQQLGIKKS